MMLHTENEQLQSIQRNLFSLDKLVSNKRFTIEDIGELIPGILHTIRPGELLLEYVSKNSEDILNISFDEIREQGTEFFHKRLHPDFLENGIRRCSEFIKKGDENNVMSYFQKIKVSEAGDYKWFFSSVKLHKKSGGVIAISYPVNSLGEMASKIEAVLGDHEFMKRNFNKFASLTKREKEILKEIALGKTSRQISEAQFTSLHTVNTHRRNIIHKLELKTVADWVKFARAFELVQ